MPFIVGIRKYVELGKVHYWLLIKARAIDSGESEISQDVYPTAKKQTFTVPVSIIHNTYWQVLIIVTVLINCCTMTWPLIIRKDWVFPYMIAVHYSCLLYWIDFIAAIVVRFRKKYKQRGARERSVGILIIDALSLTPLSIVYLIVESNPYPTTFVVLRYITVLRMHRVLSFFYTLTMSARNHWKSVIVNQLIFLYVFAEAFFCYVFIELGNFSPFPIQGWNDTVFNRMVVSWYFCMQTVLFSGAGDILPVETLQRLVCVVVTILGYSQVGIITSILTTAFANNDEKRERYRQAYEATMKVLRDRKIDKRTLDRISDNMMTIWRYSRGVTGPVNIDILPPSLQKEVCFDINFGLLNRSLIFSMHPTSFLRSVSLFMKTITYLPGDIISEPFALSDALLCVASGVIEVVSEENDETVLFSLTSGTIIGEATLFISIPMRCIIRAATYVEMQVLTKVNFARLWIRYPDIIRQMRSEIYYRLNLREYSELDASNNYDSDFQELSRRKETKRFLQELRKKKEKTLDVKRFRVNAYKSAILNLYVLSENIPPAKTLPIVLVRARPWILRPNTTLMTVWRTFIVILVSIVVFLYPIYAAFERTIPLKLNFFMVFTEVAYIVDLCLECVTAIEREDKYSFVITIKEIIAHKLKTFGFYLDILAAYDFSVYADLKWFTDRDYAALLLSLNRVLKVWRIVVFFQDLEDNIKSTLLVVRTAKYFFFFSMGVVWGAAVLYIDACPTRTCRAEGWYAQEQIKEAKNKELSPCTAWPLIVSMYVSCLTLAGVSYGDITPTSIIDSIFYTFCIMAGITLLAVCMSQASSTFKHLARVRSEYQFEVFAVDRFMSEHDIPKQLTLEVRNYLQVQWNYDNGFTLMSNGTTEKLTHQQRQIIVTELMKPFLTVPLFRKAGSDFLKLLARSCKVRLLPPNDVITESGSPDREMFILENGYCEVTAGTESKVIGPVNPFGYYEMIVGIPLQIRVRTLTHARIITLNYTAYLRAVTRYPGVKMHIDDTIEQVSKRDRTPFDSLGCAPLDTAHIDGDRVMRQKELLSRQIIDVCKYNANLSLNYWQPFTAWGKLRFFQFCVLPFVIEPNSFFIKIWFTLRIINVMLIGLVAPVYFSLPNNMEMLTPFMIGLQAFAGLDMYVMFHVGYYDDRGLLMFHPAKTATWYLKGNFIIDLLTLFPHYLLVRKIFPPENNIPNFLYDGLGFIVVLQFYKFIQGCYYLENDILRKSETFKILKFVPLAIIMSNCVTGLMVLLQCREFEYIYRRNTTVGTKLASEWMNSINDYCSQGSGTNATEKEHAKIFRMYLITYYWVVQSMTGCGFGDITAHNKTTMVAVVVIIFLGVVFYGYMFADLTSGMITAYVFVTKYRRRIWEMSVYMKDKEVDSNLHKRLVLYYEYKWQRTEGAKPQKVFACVHTALRQSIMCSIYEATVQAVPGFADAWRSIVRVIGQHLDEMYFLNGEVIVNHKDVLEHIYLLYRGSVDLMSADGEVIATMGRGGLFGNVSNTPFSLSSVMVVAAQNTDVVRLHSDVFFKALRVSPNTKSLLEFLTSKKKDYIIPLTARSPHASSDVYVSFSNARTIPYEITTIHAHMPRRPFSGNEVSPQRTSFHFKNSIFKGAGKDFWTFVILPETGLYNMLEIIWVVLAYLSSIITMFMFSFQNMSTATISVSYVLDFLFLVQIVLRYHMSYFDKFGDYVVDPRMIAKRYHKSTTIFYDVISNLPLEIFALVAPHNWRLCILSALRMNRTVRLAYIFEYHKLKLQTLMVNKIYLEFCWILICGSLMLHFFTCLLYFVECPLGVCYTPCFLSEMDLLGKGQGELYVVSLYYIAAITTTVGYTGVPLYSNQEVVLSVTIMIASRFGVVLLIATLVAALNAHGAHLFIYQEKISALKEKFLSQRISEYQMSKMWNYVKSLWFYKSGRRIPKFITTAPYAMRCEVMNDMFGSHLSQSYIFSDLDPAFLRQLSIYLTRNVYFPGNYILQQGDIDHTMYFIHKGKLSTKRIHITVSVLTIHPDLMETIHFTLVDNDTFGIAEGLNVEKAHRFTYRALTDVVILSLTLSHWKHLLKYFPGEGQEIYRKLNLLKLNSDSIMTT